MLRNDWLLNMHVMKEYCRGKELWLEEKMFFAAVYAGLGQRVNFKHKLPVLYH